MSDRSSHGACVALTGSAMTVSGRENTSRAPPSDRRHAWCSKRTRDHVSVSSVPMRDERRTQTARSMLVSSVHYRANVRRILVSERRRCAACAVSRDSSSAYDTSRGRRIHMRVLARPARGSTSRVARRTAWSPSPMSGAGKRKSAPRAVGTSSRRAMRTAEQSGMMTASRMICRSAASSSQLQVALDHRTVRTDRHFTTAEHRALRLAPYLPKRIELDEMQEASFCRSWSGWLNLVRFPIKSRSATALVDEKSRDEHFIEEADCIPDVDTGRRAGRFGRSMTAAN